ncbi:MAG: low molecular weight phosphotyrosine protein phosphatase [Campylobacteraceae bacterium]|nr:low molecular weight phosphotyrosine protein phosphatase [Campylobacteraceae bacterium]
MLKKLLFVCLGNICRSPLAEGIARDYINKNNLDIIVDGAGTGDWHVGNAPYPNVQKVSLEFGIDISGLKARQVTHDDFTEFDLLIGLDEKNVADLKNLGCINVVKLGNYVDGNPDIPDPYFFEGYEGYDTVYKLIEKCVIQLLEKEK